MQFMYLIEYLYIIEIFLAYKLIKINLYKQGKTLRSSKGFYYLFCIAYNVVGKIQKVADVRGQFAYML